MARQEQAQLRVEHPNRRKASSKLTRLLVVVLLWVSAALVLVVTVGGWSTLAGAKPAQVAYVLVYAVLAILVARWRRGVLPLVAALAVGLLIFAAVSVPGWLARDQPGFADPGLPSAVLGVVTALLIPVQLLLIGIALNGFRQGWNIEVEHAPTDDRRGGRGRAAGEGDGDRGHRNPGDASADTAAA